MFKSEISSIGEAVKVLKINLGADLINITVFGSRARGDFSKDSDLDVLVVVKNKTIPVSSFINDTFYDEELKNDIPFSVTVMPEKSWEKNKKFNTGFYLNIKREGKIFYGTDV